MVIHVFQIAVQQIRSTFRTLKLECRVRDAVPVKEQFLDLPLNRRAGAEGNVVGGDVRG